MAQGPWDTGTWDDALWDSLPITGNAATGSPGSVGVGERTVAITGNAGTGAAGTVTPSESVSVTGVQATGAAGTVSESDADPLTGNAATGAVGTAGPVNTIALTGVQATGAVGTVSETDADPLVGNSATGQVGTVGFGGVTVALTGAQATGAVGTVFYTTPPIIITDDTHDGDYHKKLQKRFDEEKQRLEQRRKDVIAAYERIVEGKPDLAKELTAGFEVIDKQNDNKNQAFVSNIDFDRLINDLASAERLWNEYLEMEDEDLMVLL